MTIKVIIAAAALAVAPTLVLAQCSSDKHQAQSCAEGYTLDSASGTCVPLGTT